ncbi:MAG: H4MPT-linked C1 transfer pathway protein [Candidatus Bathyarchaeota archaeon]|nr:H4MPT-linked C1 transfer pathway protein [Candidatus Bathyarchaeota archaeon]
MINILGLDVGGANIKAAVLKAKGINVKRLKTVTEYFPIWKVGKEKLPAILKKLILKLGEFNFAGVTMTAELSDVYFTKIEGVKHVLRSVKKVLSPHPILVLNVDGELITVDEAENQPYKVASANWYASGWLASKIAKDCIVIDIGSTTTTITPVKNGRVSAEGKNDLEKLACGELVYTGALRTNVATVTQTLNVKGLSVKVSSEYFASTADVYLVLNEISRQDYTVDTADGRGKSMKEALARIARVVCADVNMLRKEEIISLAIQIADKQLSLIVEALSNVFKKHWKSEEYKSTIPIFTAGVKSGFLAKKAAIKAGFQNVSCLNEKLNLNISRVLPSAGLAFMVAEKFVKDFRFPFLKPS